MTTRTHINKDTKPITLRVCREEQKVDFKPFGFWYGVNGDWERWCRAEQWGLHGTMYEHELTLGQENLLILSSVADIDCFHNEFKASLFPGLKYFQYIDWRRVVQKWDGIEIAPYQWDRRHAGEAHSWYYPWDCASGCIWRPKGARLTLLREVYAL